MQLHDVIPSSRPTGENIVEGEGVLLWIHTEESKLSGLQFLGMYGGIEIVSSHMNAVFFFRAVNHIPFALLYKSVALRYDASIYIQEGTIFVDGEGKKYIEYVSAGLPYQEEDAASSSHESKIYLHSELVRHFTPQPGVKIFDTIHQEGWCECSIHRNATITQGLLWNIVIKAGIPITGEKKSNLLWQSTLQSIEEFLRNKKMQVAKHNNNFLQLIFSSQEQLRDFIFDYNNFITLHTQEMGEDSFTATAVIATLQKNTSMFSANIDTYYTFDNTEMIFNHCHTTLYDALILGKEFAYIPTREPLSFTSWVVILEKQEVYKKDVQMLVPTQIGTGSGRCFYCGMHNHTTAECPTHVFSWDTSLLTIWDKVGAYPFEELIKISKQIDETFEQDMSLQEIMDIYDEESEKGLFVKALYSIPLLSQLRAIPYMFSRKHNEQVSFRKINKQEAQIQYICKRIASQEGHQIEHELYELVKQNKDYRYYTFLGFTSVEKGDLARAINFWKEAERLSYTPKLVAWHLHLQGRAYEIMGQFNNALGAYKQALFMEPHSKEIRYRYIITLIQMGKVETAMKLLEKHIHTYPEDFVKILFDVQAKQGYLEITRVLNRMLQEYASRVEQVEKEIANDNKHIAVWGRYDPTTFQIIYNDFYQYFEQRKRKDFLTYSIILEKYAQYQESFNKNVTYSVDHTLQRVDRIFNKLYILKEHLKTIPVRSQLKDFSRQLDVNMAMLEKIDKASLERSDYFEFIVNKLDEIESKMGDLEYGIHFMQFVRDSSLFIMLFLRNFIVVEMIIAMLVVLGIPTLFYYATQTGMLTTGMPEFSLQWNLQKNTLIVATGIALLLVGSGTLLQFKKRKRVILMQFLQEINRT